MIEGQTLYNMSVSKAKRGLRRNFCTGQMKVRETSKLLTEFALWDVYGQLEINQVCQLWC